MANKSGNAYALTILCPIRHGVPKECPEGLGGQTHAACLRHLLQDVVRVSENSPMARVPNTYLSRFYILTDVPYQGKPAILEHLKNNYLVFSVNFHGELEPYLEGMWNAIEPEIRELLQHCFGFEKVHNSRDFVEYIKKCQIETTFFFNGSTDEPLAVQLKGLYLKQEFSKFVYANQGRRPEQIQAAFQEFVKTAQPGNLEGPTWRPGAYKLESVVIDQRAKGAGAK
jgi:hypothetical protein